LAATEGKMEEEEREVALEEETEAVWAEDVAVAEAGYVVEVPAGAMEAVSVEGLVAVWAGATEAA